MSIKAITSTMPQNNNINFMSGNKKQETQTHSNSHTAPIYKAVPLAVLIAMSPLSINAAKNNHTENENNIELVSIPKTNNVEQSGKIISTKRMTSSNAPVDINVIDNNGKKNVQFVYHTAAGDVVANTTQIAKYNYTLISDDGSHKTFTLKRPLTFTDEELAKDFGSPNAIIPREQAVMNYVEELQKKYPDAVKNVTYNRRLSTTENGSLRNNGGGDIMKDAVAKPSYGQKIWSDDFQSETGKYSLRLYSTDGNNDDAEVLTLQKEGYPELHLRTAIFFKKRFFYDAEYAQTLSYGQVQLEDANKKIYNIVDTTLAKVVELLEKQLEEQNAFHSAYATVTIPYNYMVTTKGTVSNVNR